MCQCQPIWNTFKYKHSEIAISYSYYAYFQFNNSRFDGMSIWDYIEWQNVGDENPRTKNANLQQFLPVLIDGVLNVRDDTRVLMLEELTENRLRWYSNFEYTFLQASYTE